MSATAILRLPMRSPFACATLLALFALPAPTSAQDAALSKSHRHVPAETEPTTAPLVVDTSYTFDVWQAADGGNARGTRYLDNFDVVADADLERLIGWSGATARVYGLYNNGRSISELLGDAQAASNIETGIRAVRLYEAWLDAPIAKNASLRVGLYDLNSEFDALEASGLFMGSAHGIGTDFSQSGQNGPSIFPVTSVAARVAMTPAPGWVLRAAVLDGVPGSPDRPRRTAIGFGRGEGALIVGEVEAPFGDGKLLLGHWRYTSRFDTFAGTRARGNSGIYLRGERHLTHEDNDAEQGLAGFFRLGLADGRINPFRGLASAGVNYTGPIDGRDSDQLGLAIAAAFTSDAYRLSSGAGRSEIAVELTYRAQIADWLIVQPDVQYIINPGAARGVPNALALGLRTELTYRFSFGRR